MDKVLIYALQEGFGGIEEFTLNLIRYSDSALQKYGYIVLGNKTVYEKEFKMYNAEYFFVPTKRKPFKNIMVLYKLLKRQRSKYNILYFNTSGLYYPIPYLIACIFNYRVILHSHLSEVEGWKKGFHIINRLWINKVVDVRLACSTPAAKWMFGKQYSKSNIIPNAINIERFKFNSEARNVLRNKLHLENSLVIGHVGRLETVKNQQWLLEILVAIKEYNAQTKLILVGDGRDRDLLREKAKILDISDNVIFYGSTTQPEYVMNCMDCFVMPSFVEGFPITLIEAQAAGLQCVVSDNITREINITGDVSFISLSKSADDWARIILGLKFQRANNMDTIKKAGYDVRRLEENVWRQIERGANK